MRRGKKMLEGLEDDIRDHIERETRENVERGMSPEEARYAAMRKFGNVTWVMEETREVWATVWLEQLLQDIRFGWRLLWKSPGISCVALLTLALGIGANTAIFSVINAVLLRPLPYPQAKRLTMIWSGWGKEMHGPASGPEFSELRKRSRTLEEIAGIWGTSGAITGNGEPEQVRVGQVTANFLSLLVEKPQLGRLFEPGEDRGGSPALMILADGLWRRQYGADPAIIGKTAHFNGNNFTVIGVLPRDFKLLIPDGHGVPPGVEVFVTFRGDLEKQDPSVSYIRTIGRLHRGATVEQARSEAESITTQLRNEFTVYTEQGLRLSVASLQNEDTSAVKPALLALFVAVGLVLLITCANVANLLLSRSGARRREAALRAALGAGRSRILRQLLTESLLLGCMGGALALGVGWAAVKWMLSLEPEGIVSLVPVHMDASVLVFTALISLGTGLLFGLAPALEVVRVDLNQTLKEGGKGGTRAKHTLRQLLIAGEVSLGFMLLVGTGLMVRTFTSLLRLDPGFQPQNVLTFRLAFPGSRYRTLESVDHFLKELRDRLAAGPGTESVGAVSHLPLDDSVGNWYSYYWPDGATAKEQNSVMADHRSTMPGYFQGMGATLLAGRDLMETDDAAHPHVAVIDDTLAEQTWPGQNPIGKKLSVEDSPSGPFQFERESVLVVGVVRHLQSHELTSKERGQIYLPFALAPRPQISFVVKTNAPREAFAAYVQQQVRKLDKDMPISNLRTQTEYVEKARAQTRFVTVLAGGLGTIALLLACLGIYGVTSYAVAQRTSEIAIRLALGARSGNIGGLVVRQGVLPIAGGVAAGVVLAAALTPLLAGLLYGVRPGDPLTYAAIAVLLGAVGVVACVVPARRAMQVDPMVALRHE